jgi:hypothetical protein
VVLAAVEEVAVMVCTVSPLCLSTFVH